MYIRIQKQKDIFFSCFKDLNNFDNGESIHKPDVILFLSEWKYGSLVPDGQGHSDQVVVEVTAGECYSPL